MRTLFAVLLLSALSFAGTLTGQLALPNTSLPLKSGTLTFTLSQSAYVPGSFLVVPQSVNCYTDSQQGNVVGYPDPLIAPVVTPDTISGSLPGATYYVVYVYRDAASHQTFYSPETTVLLSGAGKLTVNPPALQPAGTTWDIYIGTSSGGETAQATAQAFGNYIQSTPLVGGAALPASNATVCSLRFTDELIPSGTWYNTNLVTSNGSQIPGFPQRWQMYGGSNATINLSNGFPLYQNITVFPTPIYANPPSGSQSITGNVSVLGSLTANSFKYASGVQPAMVLRKGSGAGNYASASTSYVDVDGSTLSYTATVPVGWKLSVVAVADVFVQTAVVQVQVALFDSASGILNERTVFLASAGGNSIPATLASVITGDGASHTIKLQYKTTNVADSVAIYNISSTFTPTMVFTLLQAN